MSRYSTEPDEDGQRQLPPRLDPRAGRPARSGGDHPARTGPARTRGGVVLLRVVGALLSLALLATCGWGWYLGRVAQASVTRTDAIPTTGNHGSHGGAAMNLLLVGNDTRDDLSKAQQAQLHAGDDGGGINTDTMILVHLPADGSRASFVSLPRDSYVQIPGHGWDKLNAAYAYGYMATPKSEPAADRKAAGSRLLVQTVSQLTGLQIDHYAEVDLLGFYNLSTVVGGVQVNLCAAVHDSYSGANFPAGVQTISGADALKFVRQRHNIGTTSSDFDRIRRQQVFIAGVARKMLSENVMLNPGKQRQLVQALAQSLTVDQSLDLMSLAQQMQSVKPGSIQFQTLPYVGDDKDSQGRYILRLKDTATLHKFFSQLSADPAPSKAGPATATTPPAPPATVAPSLVKVAVYNGSGRSGLAASAATDLKAKGFTVTATGNADASTYTQTEIRFATGDEAEAATLAAAIPGATTKQLAGATAGTLQLVLGSGFTKVGTPVAGTAATDASASGTQTEDLRTAADTGCIN